MSKRISQKIVELCESVKDKNGKYVFWLSEPEGQNYKIGLVVFNNVFPNAEIHAKGIDVWHVVRGEGAFILGGKLENGTEKKPNEWVAESILGGERQEVREGDIIDIPAGIPHQIDARGKILAMVIIKISVT